MTIKYVIFIIIKAIVLDFQPYLDVKTLLLKTQYIWLQDTGKQVLNWPKNSSYWLAFTVMEGAMQTAEGEKIPVVFSSAGP